MDLREICCEVDRTGLQSCLVAGFVLAVLNLWVRWSLDGKEEIKM
jgi:hypothetical protein